MFEDEDELSRRREDFILQQQLLDAFKAHFFLSEAEIETMILSSEPVGPTFFNVVRRAKEIYRDCEVLLINENQSLG